MVSGVRIQNNARADIRTEHFDVEKIIFFEVSPDPAAAEK